MRRSLVMSFVISLLIYAIPVFASVQVPPVTGNVGDTINVPVNINISGRISGFQVLLTYDSSSLRFIKATTGTLDEGWAINYNKNTTGKLSVAGFSPELNSVSGSGSVVEVTFTVLKDNPSPVSVSSYKLVDSKAKTVSALNANTVSSKKKTSGGGGCTIDPNAGFSVGLILLVMLPALYYFRRKLHIIRTHE